MYEADYFFHKVYIHNAQTPEMVPCFLLKRGDLLGQVSSGREKKVLKK
jgi:hypothetical protein